MMTVMILTALLQVVPPSLGMYVNLSFPPRVLNIFFVRSKSILLASLPKVICLSLNSYSASYCGMLVLTLNSR